MFKQIKEDPEYYLNMLWVISLILSIVAMVISGATNNYIVATIVIIPFFIICIVEFIVFLICVIKDIVSAIKRKINERENNENRSDN